MKINCKISTKQYPHFSPNSEAADIFQAFLAHNTQINVLHFQYIDIEALLMKRL